MQIKNYPNYYITKDGKIWSKYKKEFKSTFISNKGYKRICLYKKSVGNNFSIHRLIALHYIDNPKKFPIIHHKDGNKLNNHISNLEWCTYSTNEKHSFKLGLKSFIGSKNNFTKLTEKDIIKIRKLDMKQKDIAKMYNVSNGCICAIINRYNWKHV